MSIKERRYSKKELEYSTSLSQNSLRLIYFPSKFIITGARLYFYLSLHYSLSAEYGKTYFKPLRNKINLNYSSRLNPYCIGNRLGLGYRNKTLK